MAVDIYKTFPPRLEIQECIGGFLHIECALIDTDRKPAVLAGSECPERHILHALVKLHLVGHIVDLPVLQLADILVAVAVLGQSHFPHDTLEILDGATEVDASHSLDENVETGTLRTGGYHKLLLAVAAVELADIFSVYENLGEIMSLVNGKKSRRREGGKLRGIHYRSKALVIFLHCLQLHIALWLGKTVEKRCDLGKLEFLHSHRLDHRRHGSLLLPVHILSESLAEFPVFGCGLA